VPAFKSLQFPAVQARQGMKNPCTLWGQGNEYNALILPVMFLANEPPPLDALNERYDGVVSFLEKLREL
jgi:hypothetical protein